MGSKSDMEAMEKAARSWKDETSCTRSA